MWIGRTLVALAALCWLTGQLLAAESPERDTRVSAPFTPGSELPPAEAIVAGLKAKEDSILNLVVTTNYSKLVAFQRPEGKEVRLNFETQATVTTDGRVIQASTGELSYHIGTGAISRGQMAAVHNGKFFAQLELSPEGEPKSASLSDHATWHGVHPLEFTIYYFGKPISKHLSERGAVLDGRRTWDGREVAVIETRPFVKEQSWKTQYWIDLERNYTVVRRAALIQYQKDGPWQEYTRIEGRDHREIAPDIWLPMQFKYESVETTPEGKDPKLSWRHKGKNENWRVNEQLAADTFELEFPEGISVMDRRTLKPQ